MAIVIIREDNKIDLWKNTLKTVNPTVPIYSYLEKHPKEEITMAIVWKHPSGELLEYPNLKCIASAGAGVDFIFKDKKRPLEAAITRIVDPLLASDMAEYLLAVTMMHLKKLNTYKRLQRKQIWKPKAYLRIKDVTIGILGLGAIGACAAEDLKKVGFTVQGWSSSKKSFDNILTFSGKKDLVPFLRTTNILVCLLPFTPKTKGFLNQEVLTKLPKNSYVINVARGGLLANYDLIPLLNSGHLAGACLDVFDTEPLPKDHSFWSHPKIDITPHCASVSDINSVAKQLLENYKRLTEDKPLLNLVDPKKGY